MFDGFGTVDEFGNVVGGTDYTIPGTDNSGNSSSGGSGGSSGTGIISSIVQGAGGWGNITNSLLQGLTSYFGSDIVKKSYREASVQEIEGIDRALAFERPYLQGNIDRASNLFDYTGGRFRSGGDQYTSALNRYLAPFSPEEVPRDLIAYQNYNYDQAARSADNNISAAGLAGSGAGLRAKAAALAPLQLGNSLQTYNTVMKNRMDNISNLNAYMGRFNPTSNLDQFIKSNTALGNLGANAELIKGTSRAFSTRGQAGQTEAQLGAIGKALSGSGGSGGGGGSSGGGSSTGGILSSAIQAIPVIGSFF